MPNAQTSTFAAAFNAFEGEDGRSNRGLIHDPRREYYDRHRNGRGAQPLFAVLQCNSVVPGDKSRAPSPCWSNSTTKPVKWRLVAKKEAAQLMQQLEDFERQTRQRGRQDGAIGRNGLAIFRALLFKFLNYANGRLDPGYKAIAGIANISERSVARGLAKLKAAGVLDWVRRCKARIEAGRVVLDQETNAYGIVPSSCWRRYRPSSKLSTSPAPDPQTYGATPPLPSALDAASIEQSEGGSRQSVLRQLENDEGDEIALALARLGRAMEVRENEENSRYASMA